jgi:hypothetical protein
LEGKGGNHTDTTPLVAYNITAAMYSVLFKVYTKATFKATNKKDILRSTKVPITDIQDSRIALARRKS